MHKKCMGDIEMENVGDYHYLYVWGSNFLIKDILKTFKKICLEMWNLKPAHFYFAPSLVWVAAFK